VAFQIRVDVYVHMVPPEADPDTEVQIQRIRGIEQVVRQLSAQLTTAVADVNPSSNRPSRRKRK
jgi:hypothetical protein